MIGLLLGTSEGKNILSLLNKFTDDIFVSCTTEYGAELLKGYKFKKSNSKPLTKEELKVSLKNNNIEVLIDSTHPYAVEITKNAMDLCKELNIPYIRFEREGVSFKYLKNTYVSKVEGYFELKEKLGKIKGTILNTTGSRGLQKLLELNLSNRIVHRVLPTEKVIKECNELNIRVDDIIAMKGPLSKELNISFIKEYNGEAMLLKDSGEAGGTEEKLKACIECKIPAFIICRKTIKYDIVFNKEENLVAYIEENYLKHMR